MSRFTKNWAKKFASEARIKDVITGFNEIYDKEPPAEINFYSWTSTPFESMEGDSLQREIEAMEKDAKERGELVCNEAKQMGVDCDFEITRDGDELIFLDVTVRPGKEIPDPVKVGRMFKEKMRFWD